MIRHFCDRCGREDLVVRADISLPLQPWESPVEKSIELCLTCASGLKQWFEPLPKAEPEPVGSQEPT